MHFDVGDWQFRCTWFTNGRFVWERRNNWFGFELAPITLTPSPMYEAEVITQWDSMYNWTRVTLEEDGAYESECFFTIYPGYDNITASLTAGKVTMTIGKSSLPAAAGLFTFAAWFLGLLTGVNTFGMPEVFVWVLRIFTFIGVLSFIILAKEFIPTLP